jgi:hypothetical protein
VLLADDLIVGKELADSRFQSLCESDIPVCTALSRGRRDRWQHGNESRQIRMHIEALREFRERRGAFDRGQSHFRPERR